MALHEDLRLTEAQLAELQRAVEKRVSGKKAPRRKQGTFVMVPYPDILEVAAKAGGAPLAVMLGVLFESWKQDTRTIRLSGVPFERAGISRHARQRALRQLQAAGFVEISKQAGSKPMITLLWQAVGANSPG